MSTVEKLKKKAAEFEQKKQFDRALEVYLQIIGQTEGQEDRDVTVYNRVGDLYLRLNKTDQAVNYYEQAVDLYTDGGYLNNAIALCNKILRHAPSRHQIYYKLGKISAKKGFNSDAKKNFLEYADRMHRAGRETDAFKALQEFADLCPGQDDIRLMLADQLARAGKKIEAIEQLQILHESLDAEGRTNEAEATAQRMHSLDPSVEPRRANAPRQKEASGLVFLDLGGSPTKPRPKVEGLERTRLVPEPPARPRTPPHVQPSPEFEQLPDIEPATPDSRVPGLEIQRGASINEIEPAFDLSVSDVDVSPLEGLESAADPSSFAIDPAAEIGESSVEGLVPGIAPEPGLGEPLETDNPLAGLNILEVDRFSAHDENPPASRRPKPAAGPEVPEIHTLDLEEPELQEEEPSAPPPRKVARRTPQKQEPKEEEEKRPPPEVLKQSKLKVVEPVRPTRPKPKVEKARPKETPSEGSEKRPVNPFQRERPKPKSASPKSSPRLTTPEAEIPRAATPKENPPLRSGDESLVDLADWMREDSAPRSYRMVAEDDQRVGEEQADFTDMLEKFKAGVARNVDDEDFDSHYDLGVAYREMDLFDEAIFEFQKALRGATQRIRAYEALGQCFIDRNEYDVAITILGRALREPGMEDEDLIGVLYLLGYASEESRKPRDAAAYYHRVFAIDIDFRDVSKRLKSMSKAASK